MKSNLTGTDLNHPLAEVGAVTHRVKTVRGRDAAVEPPWMGLRRVLTRWVTAPTGGDYLYQASASRIKLIDNQTQ